jgi:hypothetical protein
MLRLRRAAPALAIGLAAGAVLFACSSFSSPGDDPTADGGGESNAPDVVSGDDTGSDSGDAGDARFGDAACSWLCDDFEKADWPTGTGWSVAQVDPGASIERTTEVAVSPTHAIRSHLSADGGTINPKAVLGLSTFAAKSIHCAVSIRIERSSGDNTIVIAFTATAGGLTHYFYITSDGSNGKTETNEDGRVTFAPQLNIGAWYRVAFDYELGKATVATVNGAVINDDPSTTSPAADAGNQAMNVALELGAFRNGANDAGSDWLVYYDDFACDLTN